MIKFRFEIGALIVDALNGVVCGEGILPEDHLYHNVLVSVLDDGLGDKWAVSYAQIELALKQLSSADAASVLERVQKFWADAPHHDLRRALYRHDLIDEEIPLLGRKV